MNVMENILKRENNRENTTLSISSPSSVPPSSCTPTPVHVSVCDSPPGDSGVQVAADWLADVLCRGDLGDLRDAEGRWWPVAATAARFGEELAQAGPKGWAGVLGRMEAFWSLVDDDAATAWRPTGAEPWPWPLEDWRGGRREQRTGFPSPDGGRAWQDRLERDAAAYAASKASARPAAAGRKGE